MEPAEGDKTAKKSSYNTPSHQRARMPRLESCEQRAFAVNSLNVIPQQLSVAIISGDWEIYSCLLH